MRSIQKYRIAVAVLAAVIVTQWAFILARRPKKPPAPERKLAKQAVIKGRIAIVLDDWGYNLNNLPLLENINYPLTASVLPNLAYSSRIAAELDHRGIEVILHLPMEPHEKFRMEKDTIMLASSDETVRNILKRDLASIAYAKGVSNHMGSLATEEARVMEIIFKELKRQGLYFLDSFVTAKSSCRELSRKIGLGFAARDIFLDNIEDSRYIRGQLAKLRARAKAKGQAIGIGHDRKTTLGVLKEVMPQMEKEGYKFVFVSELVK